MLSLISIPAQSDAPSIPVPLSLALGEPLAVTGLPQGVLLANAFYRGNPNRGRRATDGNYRSVNERHPLAEEELDLRLVLERVVEEPQGSVVVTIATPPGVAAAEHVDARLALVRDGVVVEASRQGEETSARAQAPGAGRQRAKNAPDGHRAGRTPSRKADFAGPTGSIPCRC